MIDSCQFTKGYPLRLPCIGKKAFRFQTGITLLFGPNGCGKSTLLQAMAAYSAIKGGGWTRYYDPLDLTSLDLAKKRECRLPKNYTVLVRNVFEARVDWDGTPTMYHHAGVSDQTSFACLFDSAGDSHDGITTPWSRSPP